MRYWCLVLLTGLSLIWGCSKTAEKEQMQFPVIEFTIADVHKAFKEGRCTCEQLVKQYLTRIEKYDQSTKLNSIVRLNPAIMDEAKRLDEEFSKTGKLKPLHCIPVIVKDNYNTEGIETTAGSLTMAGTISDKDAYQVRKIKDAGALVLAKSNMAEWAFSPMVTISSIAGETLNPYNLLHTTAGSSGGTAAAVAANLGMIGLGTDTGNSIRGPSSHNALVGFRSTFGLTSREGIVPLYLRNDVGGPMARTVEDATKILQVIAGYDPNDPVTAYCTGKVEEDYLQFLDKDGLKGARIGVFRTLSERDTDPQVSVLFNQAIEDMKALGAVIVDSVEVPNFESHSSNQWCPVFPHDLNEYLVSLNGKSKLKSFDQILPSGKYSDYIKANLEYFVTNSVDPNEEDSVCSDPYIDRRRISYRRAMENAMDKYDVEVLIYPSWNHPPARIGDFSGYKGDNSQIIAPHTGQPAFTVPMGYSYDNLPAGLQFLGRMYDEPTLIRLTYAYEQGTLHRTPPAKFE
ncbi:MAG: amidase family protein [Bacteroidota bacterium]